MESSLGFTPDWFAAGAIETESAAAFARYAAADPAKPARHWRWLAFRDHLEECHPLTAEQCRALFALGQGEPDANLGLAIVVAILHQPNCPEQLRESARGSENEAVRRIASRFPPRNAVANRRGLATPTPSV